RLQHYDDLWIDCAGDEFDDPVAVARFFRAPYFSWFDGKVGFGARWFGRVFEGYGSASAFVPQN
ncbi:MAG TPA: hypothetical protein VJH25_02155, partial [Candidatus Paceibacterota bacterium]